MQHYVRQLRQELLGPLERRVMKETRFGTKMKRAQNYAGQLRRELLGPLERRVMKEKRFWTKM